MGRWLITGAGGLLGRELTEFLRSRNDEQAIALTSKSLDIRDREAVEDAVRGEAVDVVVNCAAWTDADEAETAEFEALKVNGYGVGNLAGACLAAGVRLIHVSSDYVFDGTAGTPYEENAFPRPCNAYGRTKLVGEHAVLATLPDTGYVVRTAWLYGRHGANFVQTMMELEGRRPVVEVVDDQIGQPTWARDLARHIVALHRADAPAGVYHGTSEGQTTWYGLAREVFTLLGADPERVRPISSAQWNARAPRPSYSVLGHRRWTQAGLAALPHWKDALRGAFPALGRAGAARSASRA
jgi:dTDP-4-dehydrorhamnose reductase